MKYADLKLLTQEERTEAQIRFSEKMEWWFAAGMIAFIFSAFLFVVVLNYQLNLGTAGLALNAVNVDSSAILLRGNLYVVWGTRLALLVIGYSIISFLISMMYNFRGQKWLNQRIAQKKKK